MVFAGWSQWVGVKAQSIAPTMSNAIHSIERQILVIEDEPDISALLKLHLSELPAQVTCVSDGRMGLQMALEKGPWQALVLDLRLPGMNGLDVCRELRLRGNRVPILMLTALGSELDRVLGLELGADDYLTKPFSVLELQARVRALWRACRAEHPKQADSPRNRRNCRQVPAAHRPGPPATLWLRGQSWC